MKINDVTLEARSHPEQNLKFGAGKYELLAAAEDIGDKENWGVSMTAEPKLGINPQVGISEDTPKGIYFYPLQYFISMVNRNDPLPWGNDFPYMQLFQYDRSGEMTPTTTVDWNQMTTALLDYVKPADIQQAIQEPGIGSPDNPFWFIYDVLTNAFTNDERIIIIWNKVLRELGFTSVYDPGRGWIAPGEPTQGVILDPRIITQHKMFVNRNPNGKDRKYDINWLANTIQWSNYYQINLQRQRLYNQPNEGKVRLAVANSMLRPFLGKTNAEARAMGFDQALKDAADKVIELLKQQQEPQ